MGFPGTVRVMRSASRVPLPIKMASAFSRSWRSREWSSREVQPDGRRLTEEIFPSAEMAKLVEIHGRSMAEDGISGCLAQDSMRGFDLIPALPNPPGRFMEVATSLRAMVSP